MSNTSTNRNLLFIIGFLLLTNIAVLVYFLSGKKHEEKKPGSGRSNGITEVLQSEVGFNGDQISRYEEMRDRQRENIKPLFEEMRKAKDSLFRMMGDSTVNDSVINKAADGIAQKQRILDLQTFAHFRRVRALCADASQQVKYDSAVLRMFRKMGKPARRNDSDKQEKK